MTNAFQKRLLAKKKEYGISLTGCPSFDGLRTGSIGLYSQRNYLSMYSCSGSSKQRGTNGTCWSIPLINCFSNHETVASQPPLNQQENFKTVKFRLACSKYTPSRTPAHNSPNKHPTNHKGRHQTPPPRSFKEVVRLRAGPPGLENVGCFGAGKARSVSRVSLLGCLLGFGGNNTSSSSGNGFFLGVFQGFHWG